MRVISRRLPGHSGRIFSGANRKPTRTARLLKNDNEVMIDGAIEAAAIA
jgi:hypothetical protein